MPRPGLHDLRVAGLGGRSAHRLVRRHARGPRGGRCCGLSRGLSPAGRTHTSSRRPAATPVVFSSGGDSTTGGSRRPSLLGGGTDPSRSTTGQTRPSRFDHGARCAAARPRAGHARRSEPQGWSWCRDAGPRARVTTSTLQQAREATRRQRPAGGAVPAVGLQRSSSPAGCAIRSSCSSGAASRSRSSGAILVTPRGRWRDTATTTAPC